MKHRRQRQIFAPACLLWLCLTVSITSASTVSVGLFSPTLAPVPAGGTVSFAMDSIPANMTHLSLQMSICSQQGGGGAGQTVLTNFVVNVAGSNQLMRMQTDNEVTPIVCSSTQLSAGPTPRLCTTFLATAGRKSRTPELRTSLFSPLFAAGANVSNSGSALVHVEATLRGFVCAGTCENGPAALFSEAPALAGGADAQSLRTAPERIQASLTWEQTRIGADVTDAGAAVACTSCEYEVWQAHAASCESIPFNTAVWCGWKQHGTKVASVRGTTANLDIALADSLKGGSVCLLVATRVVAVHDPVEAKRVSRRVFDQVSPLLTVQVPVWKAPPSDKKKTDPGDDPVAYDQRLISWGIGFAVGFVVIGACYALKSSNKTRFGNSPFSSVRQRRRTGFSARQPQQRGLAATMGNRGNEPLLDARGDEGL